LFVFFGPGALRKKLGTCLIASGVFVASNLHVDLGKTIGQSIRSKHFGFLNFGGYIGQLFGENTFSKNAPKRKKHIA